MGRRPGDDGKESTTIGFSAVACVDSINRRALLDPPTIAGLLILRRAGAEQEGQTSSLTEEVMARCLS